jgi:hypothetical protein
MRVRKCILHNMLSTSEYRLCSNMHSRGASAHSLLLLLAFVPCAIYSLKRNLCHYTHVALTCTSTELVLLQRCSGDTGVHAQLVVCSDVRASAQRCAANHSCHKHMGIHLPAPVSITVLTVHNASECVDIQKCLSLKFRLSVCQKLRPRVQV